MAPHAGRPGPVDLHLFGEGRHRRLWEVLGAHAHRVDGVDGVSFSVWAPNARAVRAVGDWNRWDGRADPLQPVGQSGIWNGFAAGPRVGSRSTSEILGADGALKLRADPMARESEHPPANASVVTRSSYGWGDDDWMIERAAADTVTRPLRIFEVHLGSWR